MITTIVSPAATLLALLQAPAGGGSSMTPLLIQFGLIIAIVYFIMLRPQQKQRRQHEEALRELKRGDEIVTAGGIVGTVVHIPEAPKDSPKKGLDDRVTIRSGESKLVIERGRIARILTSASGVVSSAPAEK